MTAEDLVPILATFHRQVVLPDVKRVIEDTVLASEGRLRNEMHTLYDALAQRLGTLETEYHMIVAGLQRLEERLDRVDERLGRLEGRLDGIERKLDKTALRSELAALQVRVEGLQEQIRVLEARLEE